MDTGVKTRKQVDNNIHERAFVSLEEPKNIKEALMDPEWILAMQDELNQCKRNDVWCLLPKPKNAKIIGTRRMFRNKLDEHGIVIRNNARLVAQGY
ncbi:UNVERIFIED_CONTAM: hypothetical protein ITH36_24765, partial [Salmonella enterica subsp. enterica serovar Weltevreden]